MFGVPRGVAPSGQVAESEASGSSFPTERSWNDSVFTSQVAAVPQGIARSCDCRAAHFAPSPRGRRCRWRSSDLSPAAGSVGIGHLQIFAILDGSGEVSGANGDDGGGSERSSVFAPGRGTRDEVSGWIDRAHHRGRTSGSFPRAPDGCSFALTPEACRSQRLKSKWPWAKPAPASNAAQHLEEFRVRPEVCPASLRRPSRPSRLAYPSRIRHGYTGSNGPAWTRTRGPTDYELEAAISGRSRPIWENRR